MLFIFVKLTMHVIANEIIVETNWQHLTSVVLQFLKIKTSFPPAVYTVVHEKVNYLELNYLSSALLDLSDQIDTLSSKSSRGQNVSHKFDL